MLLKNLNRLQGLIRLTQPFSSDDLRLKHVTDLVIRNNRRKYLNLTLLDKNRLVLNGYTRPFDSTIVSLKDKGKCPAVIKARSGFPEMDVVLDGKLFKRLNKDKIKKNCMLYVRINGEEIMCTIDRIELFEERFVSKVYLNRFIEGEPNEVRVYVQPTGILNNPHLFSGQAPEILMKAEIKIITYNADYPPILQYDCSAMDPLRPYRFADLANTLPPGIFLDPRINLMRRVMGLEKPNDEGLIDDDEEDEATKIEKLKELDKMESRKKKEEKKPAAGTAASGSGDKKEGGS